MHPPPGPWAKHRGLTTPYGIDLHGLDTAAMACALWRHYLSRHQRRLIAHGWHLTQNQVRLLLMFLAALHDIGKIQPAWQAAVPTADHLTGRPGYAPQPPDTPRLRHERATLYVLPELLHRLYDLPLNGSPSTLVAHQLAQIAATHHGTFPPPLTHLRDELTHPTTALPALGTDGWDRERQRLLETADTLLGHPLLPTRTAPPTTAILTAGVISLADWLASQNTWITARQTDWDTDTITSAAAHLHRALRLAPAALRDAQLRTPVVVPPTTMRAMFPDLRGHRLYPLQKRIEKELPELVDRLGPGLLLITAPTGDAKTECGLFAACVLGAAAHCIGTAMFLPNRASCEPMWERLRAHTRATTRGPAPTGLVHHLAWLDTHFNPLQSTVASDATAVEEWLRGRYRPLLGHTCAATWDQLVTDVLPARYNTVRWLGITRKTVVIDEAHAYGPYEHQLTKEALHWLGAFGIPIVLLSATLTGNTAADLVHAYRAGSGHTDTPALHPPYPGWTYTDLATGTITTSPTIPSARAHTLTITVTSATHIHDPDDPHGRAHAVLDALRPLHDSHRGSALIVCNTIADAQATYDLLAVTWGTGPRTPRLLLLQAATPHHRRTAATRKLRRWTGKGRPRPARPLVVVATQLAEQSLDIDTDLVITDLAPLALIIQRAGRQFRHPRADRPPWATGPRITVLVPPGRLPAAWLQVYDESLLDRTRTALGPPGDHHLAIPEDLPDFLDAVYELDFTTPAGISHEGRQATEHALGKQAAVPRPARITDLHQLSDGEAPHPETRLGADTLRVLPVYTTPGHTWLNRRATKPLPDQATPADPAAMHQLMNLTVPIRAALFDAADPHTDPPPVWKDVASLRHLRLLPQPLCNGVPQPYRNHHHDLSLHPTLGLVSRTTRRGPDP
ncbi:CRISPR-associated helicase Cas3' [Kitasatospora sp. NPDC056138]|uniref:CRISPR-associated helicase Cas3' n=1 Tax=Kitasatospora sp. NPDC056138 TaxID=3345724 RepID=UPI0035DD0CD6